jgi:hypothetical protein
MDPTTSPKAESPLSPARTPTPTAAPPTQPTAPGFGQPPVTSAPPVVVDPKVAELQVMFPSVDVAVIEMILESVGGSQDRAIEQLLSMTDPEFKPDETHARTEEQV